VLRILRGAHHPIRTAARRLKSDLAWLLIGLTACVLVFLFLKLAGEVMEGDTQALDVRLLRALRSSHDITKPIGPDWMEYALLDLTALGSTTVLGLMVFAVAGFLLLHGWYKTTLTVLLTSISGFLVSRTMKTLFLRPRPSLVPHLREVVSSSFPSGHAMDSAIIYLTLAALLMRVAETRLTKAYCLIVALALTFLVGASRVFLGVHYPTDVLGGWIFGFVWASLCWMAAQWFEIGGAGGRKKNR
jgi:undecaprenyl-diphosphatase